MSDRVRGASAPDDGTASAWSHPLAHLMATVWRDEHGHAYRVCSISGSGVDAMVGLRYVEPPVSKRLPLDVLHFTHVREPVTGHAERVEPGRAPSTESAAGGEEAGGAV